MKRILSLLLASTMVLSGCSISNIDDPSLDFSLNTTERSSEIESDTLLSTQPLNNSYSSTSINSVLSFDTKSEEYIESLEFSGLKSEDLSRYVADTVYLDLVEQLNCDEYFVENIETVYISKEYINELAYNTQENIYFGYKLSELDEAFQGEKYIFTLGDDGQTIVKKFEEYDDTYDKVVRNVAIGTGVILICVTVSVVTAGVGAPAISMVFAASATEATTFALASGVISGVSAGVVEGLKTHDFNKAIKAAALEGSEGFMWGAIAGSIKGGVGEARYVSTLKGADVTANGLTLQEAAKIQKESKYPLDVIKEFRSMEQYKICKDAGLVPKMVNGKTALIRDINLNYYNEAKGLTNLELMKKGNAAIDPISQKPYDLHHIGQKANSTLAILTKEEHMKNGNNKIWHILDKASEVHTSENAWDTQREEFWKAMAEMAAA